MYSESNVQFSFKVPKFELSTNLVGQIFKKQQQLNKIVCVQGKNSIKVCGNEDCTYHAFLCSNEDCKCKQNHSNCVEILISGLIKRLSSRMGDVNKFKDSLEEKIDQIIDELSVLKSKVVSELEKNIFIYGLSKNERELIQKIKQSKIQTVLGQDIFRSISKHENIDFNKVKEKLTKKYKDLQRNFNKFKTSIDLMFDKRPIDQVQKFIEVNQQLYLNELKQIIDQIQINEKNEIKRKQHIEKMLQKTIQILGIYLHNLFIKGRKIYQKQNKYQNFKEYINWISNLSYSMDSSMLEWIDQHKQIYIKIREIAEKYDQTESLIPKNIQKCMMELVFSDFKLNQIDMEDFKTSFQTFLTENGDDLVNKYFQSYSNLNDQSMCYDVYDRFDEHILLQFMNDYQEHYLTSLSLIFLTQNKDEKSKLQLIFVNYKNKLKDLIWN